MLIYRFSPTISLLPKLFQNLKEVSPIEILTFKSIRLMKKSENTSSSDVTDILLNTILQMRVRLSFHQVLF